jgi:hypothetical protein
MGHQRAQRQAVSVHKGHTVSIGHIPGHGEEVCEYYGLPSMDLFSVEQSRLGGKHDGPKGGPGAAWPVP